MKESDTISVLICVHSRDHEHDVLLQRALESLVRQTYADFETIVVLDECWEDTKGLVSRYTDVLDIRIFERPHKHGLDIAKNFGLQRCSGDWIAYLDADDLVFTAINAGTIGYAILYKDTGTASTSPLICAIDVTDTATNGGNVTFVWNSAGILKLT